MPRPSHPPYLIIKIIFCEAFKLCSSSLRVIALSLYLEKPDILHLKRSDFTYLLHGAGHYLKS
jgi:hypothetical protein